MPDDDESKQAQIPGYAEQRRSDFHETGQQAFADGAVEQNRLRRAAGINEPELTRERALQIADGWLNTMSSNSNTKRTKSDLVLVTQAPSDYDDSDITLGKQRAAQLDRLAEAERKIAERRVDINLRKVGARAIHIVR